MTSILGPRKLGGILRETFKIYRRNFWRLFVIAAIVQVALGVLLFAAWTRAPMPPGEIGIEDLGQLTEYLTLFIPIGIILFVFYIAVGPLGAGALIHAISEQYLRQTITIGQAYHFAWGRRGALIGATLLAGLAIVGMFVIPRLVVIVCGPLGIILVFIGIWAAIYFMVRWLFILPVALLEGFGPRTVLSRSSNLVRGSWWRVFGIALVVGIIVAVVTAVLQTIPVVGTTLGGILSAPIGAITLTLLYFDLRVKKEGYSLETLSKELGIRYYPENKEATK